MGGKARGTVAGGVLPRPLGGMAQPKLVNTAVAALLRTPVAHRIGSSYVMLLQFSGRKTGRLYTIPVGYYRDTGTVLTTTDDRWWRNLHPPAAVGVLLERRWYSGIAAAVPGEQEAVTGMAVLVKGCPRYAGWIQVGSDPDGEPSRDDLRREVRNGRVLIRITDLRQTSRRP